MASDWPEVSVEQIAARSPNALATGPFGSAISSRHFTTHGVPVIRGSNLSENVGVRLIHDDLVYLRPDKAQEFSRSLVRRGDLVFTCWGTIGQVGLIDERAEYAEYVISNKQMKLTPDPDKADSLFLYYAFSGPELYGEITGQSIGSSVPGFNLGQLKSLRLSLPPLHEQRAIAGILGALDDKIELNRRMNATLEALARALFTSWFVDFDPVRARAEGRQPAGMDAATAALFPDAFEESAIGPVPQGWRVLTLGDAVSFEYGKALKEEVRRPGDIPVFGSNGQVGWHDEALVAGPGVIVGRKGNPGAVTWAPTDFWPIDTTFFLQPRQHLRFWFHALSLLDLGNLGSDSAVPGLNRNMAYMTQIGVPTPGLLAAFECHVTTFDERVFANDTQSRTLAAVRDALLPKLLSGEMRVREAETMVEAAI